MHCILRIQHLTLLLFKISLNKYKLILSILLENNQLIAPTQILIADRQDLCIAGISHILSREKNLEIIGQAGSKTALEKMLHQLTPDVLVLDYANLEGFTSGDCLHIADKYPKLKMYVITSDHRKEHIMRVLESGVLAFLTKDCSRQEILSAFHAIVKGQKFFCNRVLDVLMDQKVYKQDTDNLSKELSEREIQIIRLIAKGKGTQQIADLLNLSPHTINAHRKNILKKLDATSPVEMIVKAMQQKIIQLD